MPHVLVPLAPGCEELEAVTVIDLLRRAKIDVITAGLNGEPVVASRGVTLVPDMTLDNALNISFDMIVLPGGLPGANHLRDDARVQNLLREMDKNGKYIAAICAAPKALAKAGLLANKRITSYPGALSSDELQGVSYEESSVVTDGRLITSRGPGTAMDFALTLIELLTSKQTRDEVETGLQRTSCP